MRLTALLAVALLTLFGAASYAAREGTPGAGGPVRADQRSSGHLELLVFEVDGCGLCDVFRRDILPQYQAAPTAARVPLRFIDINKTDPDSLALSGRLTQVPTAVLMKNGREVDRIAGYVGPSNFFRMLDWLLERTE